MKAHQLFKHRNGRLSLIGALLLVWALIGCTAISPKPEQLQLPSEPPALRETSFSAALAQIGILSEIYGARLLKIQCRDIDDVTGTSYHTGGEIPKSITVMVKSALNSIGGQVVYIPYWPDYFAGIQVSGYPLSDQKLVPDVILAGGITEFDRGLTTLDRTRNLDAKTESIDSAPSWFDGDTIGLDYSKGDKWNKAKIAVDFNLVSYKALCGIPKMQASNGITVYKGITEEELGFTLFGPTIGVRGSVKKVQGRHDAVRLLVQFSVIQLVGRFMDLPYWQLLDGAQPDPVVMENLKANYQKRGPVGQTLLLKRLLWLHGHPVAVNAQMDAETKAALAKADAAYDGQSTPVPLDTFLKLYLSVPVTNESMERVKRFDRLMAQFQAAEAQKALKEKKKAQPAKPKREKQSLKKQEQPIEKDKSEGSKPEAAEPPKEAPKHEVIIITPLDTQTDFHLKSIIRRIEDKRRHRINDQETLYQPILHTSRVGADQAIGGK
ncbi:MAG: hypothetical protein PVH87_20370 [Desulfobacteraceae bacterium]|jgi:hypothetical protein